MKGRDPKRGKRKGGLKESLKVQRRWKMWRVEMWIVTYAI